MLLLKIAVGVPPLDDNSQWSADGRTFRRGFHVVKRPTKRLAAAAMDATLARIGLRAYLVDGEKVFCPLCDANVDHADIGQEEFEDASSS